ncbi:hypothetical protein Tco_1133840 [Tanacetum coccineum]
MTGESLSAHQFRSVNSWVQLNSETIKLQDNGFGWGGLKIRLGMLQFQGFITLKDLGIIYFLWDNSVIPILKWLFVNTRASFAILKTGLVRGLPKAQIEKGITYVLLCIGKKSSKKPLTIPNLKTPIKKNLLLLWIYVGQWCPGVCQWTRAPNTPSSNSICTHLTEMMGLLFQPMFDESPNVDVHAPEVIAPIPGSQDFDQSASSILYFIQLCLRSTCFSNTTTTGTKDHPTCEHIIGALDSQVSKDSTYEQAFSGTMMPFLTSLKPKKLQRQSINPSNVGLIAHARGNCYEFERLEVWEHCSSSDQRFVILSYSDLKVKLDELGGILKNKARLVARGYRQEEGIDFDGVFDSGNPAKKKFMLASRKSSRAWYDLTPMARGYQPVIVEKATTNSGTNLVDKSHGGISKRERIKKGMRLDPSHYLGVIGTLLYLTAKPFHRGSLVSEGFPSFALTAFEMRFNVVVKNSRIRLPLGRHIGGSCCPTQIGKCNLRLSSDIASKEAQHYQVVYDVLKLLTFIQGLQVTADAPEI